MNKQAYQHVVGLVLTKQANPFKGPIVSAPMPEPATDTNRKDPGVSPEPKQKFKEGVLYSGSEITEENDPVWAIRKAFGGKYKKLDPNKYYKLRNNKPADPKHAVTVLPSWELASWGDVMKHRHSK